MRNSTIITKKRQLDCGCFDYAFSKNKCKMHASADSFTKRMEAATDKMIVEEDLSGLIADADAVFSQYIRLKFADLSGFLNCFTCITNKHWTLMQNGHFIKRAHLYLRWDERNCRPQCAECNEIKSGNMAEYTRRLEFEQPGITDILKEEMRLVHKPSREEIRQIIVEYTQKVKAMKQRIEKHQSLQ